MTERSPRRLSPNRDTQELIERARAGGWRVTRAGRSGHLRFTSPDGTVTYMASTPSDWRAHRNNAAKLRRQGLEAPAAPQSRRADREADRVRAAADIADPEAADLALAYIDRTAELEDTVRRLVDALHSGEAHGAWSATVCRRACRDALALLDREVGE